MIIRWRGHSCFEIENSEGKKLIFDPFDESVGYPTPMLTADVVTLSHDHHDHNCTRFIEDRDGCLILTDGKAERAGFAVEAFPTFHDEVQGKKRGPNKAFLVQCEGISVLHLGDLGHVLDPRSPLFSRKIDVLMVPVGGFYTIDSKTAYEVTCALKPKCVIPMHYRNGYCAFPISDEKEFEALCGGAKRGMKEICAQDAAAGEKMNVLLPDLFV